MPTTDEKTRRENQKNSQTCHARHLEHVTCPPQVREKRCGDAAREDPFTPWARPRFTGVINQFSNRPATMSTTSHAAASAASGCGGGGVSAPAFFKPTSARSTGVAGIVEGAAAPAGGFAFMLPGPGPSPTSVRGRDPL